jgi:hypothetical protein
MKKFLFILFMFPFHYAFAGTGSANDEILFMLVIIAILSSILVVLYSVDFIRRIMKERREKKIAHSPGHADDSNICTAGRNLFTENHSERAG